MNDNTLAVAVLALALLTIFLFVGDPDVTDAVRISLMGCAK